MMDMPLPEPLDYCYEWDGPYGSRKFSAALHNGLPPDRSVAIYSADQLRARDAQWRAIVAAEVAQERENLRAAIMAKHEAAKGQHNLYHCLSVELFGDEVIRSASPPQCTDQPSEAQPTGQSPCARHCEAPAFEGEIRRLKRELQTQAERIRVLEHLVIDAAYTLDKARIWNGMGWTYNPLHPVHYTPMRERLHNECDSIEAARAAVPPAPAAVPLTDEQRNDCIEAWSSRGWGDRLGEVVRICIAIERAHGITAAGDKP